MGTHAHTPHRLPPLPVLRRLVFWPGQQAPVSHSVSQSVSRSVGRSVSQSASQSVSQSVGIPATLEAHPLATTTSFNIGQAIVARG